MSKMLLSDERLEACRERFLTHADVDARGYRRDYEFCQRVEAREREGLRGRKKRLGDVECKTGVIAHRMSISQAIGRGVSGGQAIVSGRFLELWVPCEPMRIGDVQEGLKMERPGKTPESAESIAARVNARARKAIRRLVNANDLRGMLTLTLAPPSEDNCKRYICTPYAQQRDYAYVRRLYKIFVQRVQARHDNSWRYVAVFELHNSERTSPDKRGCWHIHLAVDHQDCEERYGDIESVSGAFGRMWGYGMVDYQDFRFDRSGNRRDTDISNPGAYIAEYIGKDGNQFADAASSGCKRYTCSRNVRRPVRKLLEELHIDTPSDTVVVVNGVIYRETYNSTYRVPNSNRWCANVHYMQEEE